MKKVIKTPAAAAASASPIMKYVLVAALAALLGFSIFYMINVQKAAKETFEEAEGSNVYQVVYIYSNSCGHCNQFTPTYNTFSQIESNNAKLQITSFEKSMPAAVPFMGYVSAFPTILIMNNGKLVNSKTGNMPLSSLQEFVSSSTSASA